MKQFNFDTIMFQRLFKEIPIGGKVVIPLTKKNVATSLLWIRFFISGEIMEIENET